MAVAEKMTPSLIRGIKDEIRDEEIFYEQEFQIDGNHHLAALVSRGQDRYRTRLVTDTPGPLILHWGVANRSRVGWTLPAPHLRPEGTAVFQNTAAQTGFSDRQELRQLSLDMKEQEAPMGLLFVLYQKETGRWIDNHGRNFYLPVVIPPEYKKMLGDPKLAVLADEIIEKEMGSSSWTLMHRFNLVHDLLDQVGEGDVDGLAMIYVWLRFSAIRQLDWQRNYNTKPRELSHSQDRLTRKLADRYLRDPREREFIRLSMTTLGTGADGQQVRDEILNIMHRHNFKEVSGNFLEEWHQKLHNNTTPDDVVICEAYLDFLKSNGDRDLFHKKLREGGVTSERLAGYERPITSPPDFVPHLKDALIPDFEHFLGILKAVHSGADLGTAIARARYLFDGEMNSLMDFLWSHQADRELPAVTLVEKITRARSRLEKKFQEQQSEARDLLFLDLALEDFLRIDVERNLHTHMEGDQMVDLIALELENLNISREDEELTKCLHHWNRLRAMPRFGREWSLRAEAVLERIGRSLGTYIDRYYQVIQPKAEFLGQAFHADPWTITLFSEEVVRGRPAFILAKLLRHLHPILRKSAELSDWQVISRGRGAGQVEVISALKSIQSQTFSRPTVVITDTVAGDENIPQGVTAIITPDATDVVSHAAIRARNSGVLLATCYNPETVEQLKSLKEKLISLQVNPAGEVIFEEGSGERSEAVPATVTRVPKPAFRPQFTAYAVPADDFNEKNVGGKSNNLKRLRDKVPEWIHLPNSVALPFGVFEEVLAAGDNEKVAGTYHELAERMDREEDEKRSEILAGLRRVVLDLKAPTELARSLSQVMNQAGLTWPEGWWNEAFDCIKQVWGSKWNDRAYLSRRTIGISHDDLFMAVLVQGVVKAEYSFVIHTVNPFTGDRDEVYAEVVLGLGETLVGNYPGRALSFTCPKGKDEPEVITFPSKSAGLYGGGLIFRSDSNGEDLAGFAGAGLYSSIMLPQPRLALLDYTNDPLLWDEPFRKGFLAAIARIGMIIEESFGSAQDIEGAYTGGEYYVVQARPQVGIEDES